MNDSDFADQKDIKSLLNNGIFERIIGNKVGESNLDVGGDPNSKNLYMRNTQKYFRDYYLEASIRHGYQVRTAALFPSPKKVTDRSLEDDYATCSTVAISVAHKRRYSDSITENLDLLNKRNGDQDFDNSSSKRRKLNTKKSNSSGIFITPTRDKSIISGQDTNSKPSAYVSPIWVEDDPIKNNIENMYLEFGNTDKQSHRTSKVANKFTTPKQANSNSKLKHFKPQKIFRPTPLQNGCEDEELYLVNESSPVRSSYQLYQLTTDGTSVLLPEIDYRGASVNDSNKENIDFDLLSNFEFDENNTFQFKKISNGCPVLKQSEFCFVSNSKQKVSPNVNNSLNVKSKKTNCSESHEDFNSPDFILLSPKFAHELNVEFNNPNSNIGISKVNETDSLSSHLEEINNGKKDKNVDDLSDVSTEIFDETLFEELEKSESNNTKTIDKSVYPNVKDVSISISNARKFQLSKILNDSDRIVNLESLDRLLLDDKENITFRAQDISLPDTISISDNSLDYLPDLMESIDSDVQDELNEISPENVVNNPNICITRTLRKQCLKQDENIILVKYIVPPLKELCQNIIRREGKSAGNSMTINNKLRSRVPDKIFKTLHEVECINKAEYIFLQDNISNKDIRVGDIKQIAGSPKSNKIREENSLSFMTKAPNFTECPTQENLHNSSQFKNKNENCLSISDCLVNQETIANDIVRTNANENNYDFANRLTNDSKTQNLNSEIYKSRFSFLSLPDNVFKKYEINKFRLKAKEIFNTNEINLTHKFYETKSAASVNEMGLVIGTDKPTNADSENDSNINSENLIVVETEDKIISDSEIRKQVEISRKYKNEQKETEYCVAQSDQGRISHTKIDVAENHSENTVTDTPNWIDNQISYSKDSSSVDLVDLSIEDSGREDNLLNIFCDEANENEKPINDTILIVESSVSATQSNAEDNTATEIHNWSNNRIRCKDCSSVDLVDLSTEDSKGDDNPLNTFCDKSDKDKNSVNDTISIIESNVKATQSIAEDNVSLQEAYKLKRHQEKSLTLPEENRLDKKSFYYQPYHPINLSEVAKLLSEHGEINELPVWLQKYMKIPAEIIEESKKMSEKHVNICKSKNQITLELNSNNTTTTTTATNNNDDITNNNKLNNLNHKQKKETQIIQNFPQYLATGAHFLTEKEKTSTCIYSERQKLNFNNSVNHNKLFNENCPDILKKSDKITRSRTEHLDSLLKRVREKLVKLNESKCNASSHGKTFPLPFAAKRFASATKNNKFINSQNLSSNSHCSLSQQPLSKSYKQDSCETSNNFVTKLDKGSRTNISTNLQKFNASSSLDSQEFQNSFSDRYLKNQPPSNNSVNHTTEDQSSQYFQNSSRSSSVFQHSSVSVPNDHENYLSTVNSKELNNHSLRKSSADPQTEYLNGQSINHSVQHKNKISTNFTENPHVTPRKTFIEHGKKASDNLQIVDPMKFTSKPKSLLNNNSFDRKRDVKESEICKEITTSHSQMPGNAINNPEPEAHKTGEKDSPPKNCSLDNLLDRVRLKIDVLNNKNDNCIPSYNKSYNTQKTKEIENIESLNEKVRKDNDNATISSTVKDKILQGPVDDNIMYISDDNATKQVYLDKSPSNLRKYDKGELFTDKNKRFVKVSLSGTLLEIYEEIEHVAQSFLNALKETCPGFTNESHNKTQSFRFLYPSFTRFLLNQFVKFPNLDDATQEGLEKKSHYSNILNLHGLVKAADLLLHCSFDSCLESLKNFYNSHRQCLKEDYHKLIKKLSALENESPKESLVHPKCIALKRQINSLNFKSDHEFYTDCKVLVVVPYEGDSIRRDLMKVFGNVVVHISAWSDMNYDKFYDMLDKAMVVVLSSDPTTCMGAKHGLPMTHFSLVAEWESKGWTITTFAQQCLRQNIRCVFLSAQINEKGDVEKDIGKDSQSNNGYKETYLFIASERVVEEPELHYVLTSMYNIELVERSVRDMGESSTSSNKGWADIIIDERTCVLLQPLHFLHKKHTVMYLVQHLILLSLQYLSVYIVLYVSPQGERNYSFRGNVVEALVRLVLTCTQFKKEKYNLNLLYAYNYHQVGFIIRSLGDWAKNSSQVMNKDDWINRKWISISMSSHERFLLRFPFINPMVAQILLKEMTLSKLLTVDQDLLLSRFPMIPDKILKMFYNMVHKSSKNIKTGITQKSSLNDLTKDLPNSSNTTKPQSDSFKSKENSCTESSDRDQTCFRASQSTSDLPKLNPTSNERSIYHEQQFPSNSEFVKNSFDGKVELNPKKYLKQIYTQEITNSYEYCLSTIPQSQTDMPLDSSTTSNVKRVNIFNTESRITKDDGELTYSQVSAYSQSSQTVCSSGDSEIDMNWKLFENDSHIDSLQKNSVMSQMVSNDQMLSDDQGILADCLNSRVDCRSNTLGNTSRNANSELLNLYSLDSQIKKNMTMTTHATISNSSFQSESLETTEVHNGNENQFHPQSSYNSDCDETSSSYVREQVLRNIFNEKYKIIAPQITALNSSNMPSSFNNSQNSFFLSQTQNRVLIPGNKNNSENSSDTLYSSWVTQNRLTLPRKIIHPIKRDDDVFKNLKPNYYRK